MSKMHSFEYCIQRKDTDPDIWYETNTKDQNLN